MADHVGEYKMQNYQKIRALNSKENLWLVMDSVTEKHFVMRRLSAGSHNVYLILSGLHHPNIAEVTDIFSYEGFHYAVEEYLEWELLSEVISDKCLSVRSTFLIGRQILEALSTLHAYGIIHRDIKPENIMIDKKGNVKLIDFDIARIFSEDKQKDTALKGSYTYAPPEQFGFSQTDCRTDIYSLGITLNELVTGTVPEERLCSGRLRVFVRRCTEFDPRRRYQTAEQALRSLRHLRRAPFSLAAGVILAGFILAFGLFPFVRFDRAQHDADTDLLDPVPEQEDEIPYSFGGYEDADIDYSELDRIIYVKDKSRYPSVLLTGNKRKEFTADLNIGSLIALSAAKRENYLELTCTYENGKSEKFEFEDVFYDTYRQNVENYINTDIENTSPEFEILFDDIDIDDKTELLVTFAWLKRVNTVNPAYRYALVEYSCVWVVYLDEQNQLHCSEPLYFEGYHPSLQADYLLHNYSRSCWYTFYNKTWETVY